MAGRLTRSGEEAVNYVVKRFEEYRKANQRFHEDVEKRYRSYRGILDIRSDAARWTSKLHPPYANQVIEAITASLTDPIKFKVIPRPKDVGMEQAVLMVQSARNLERLLAYELDIDNFAQKHNTFVRQGLITGLSIGKTYWKQKSTTSYSKQKVPRDVVDIDNQLIGSVDVYDNVQQEELAVDDPCFITVDVRDFFWPESATSIEDADCLIHRTYTTYDQLEKLQKLGLYKNVSKLKESRDVADEESGREDILFNTSRTADRIEILELWDSDHVITIGNRKVELRNGPNPFWHGQKPFVSGTGIPDLFQLPGMSVVEICAHLQEMLWTLQNQRVDNLRLLSNAVALIRGDVEDPDSFEWAPGAAWIVDSIDQVKLLEIDPTTAQITLQAEALLKGEIQNLTGGGLVAGADSQTIDQKTATGVSIVTTLAQRMIDARKRNFQYGLRDVGLHFVAMLQQFMDDDRLIAITGQGGEMSFMEVGPDTIQGRFDVSLEISNESLMRQERRAERQSLLQVSVEAAPVLAAMGTPINLKAIYEDLLEAFDIQDKEKYFVPPRQGAAVAGGAAPGQAPAPQNGSPGGVTSPLAYGPTSPSNPASLSGERHMQQMAARGRQSYGGEG